MVTTFHFIHLTVDKKTLFHLFKSEQMEKLSHRMDKNLKTVPRVDKKNLKMQPRAHNNFKKWDLKSVGLPVNVCKSSSPKVGRMFQKDF